MKTHHSCRVALLAALISVCIAGCAEKAPEPAASAALSSTAQSSSAAASPADSEKQKAEADGLAGFTDERIRRANGANFNLMYISMGLADGFKKSAKQFTGVTHCLRITMPEDGEVTLTTEIEASPEQFRAVLISPAGEISDLPLDATSDQTYALEKGKTVVALVGYKASYSIQLRAEIPDGAELSLLN